jgi:hypothetical protein
VRDSWVPKPDLCCRRWHPAKTPGVLRIASSVLHILPQTTVAPESATPAALMIGRKAAQERFSEESLRHVLCTSPETHFSKALRKSPHNSAETHGTQQAWINSRNQITIATQWKHRQPIFLHPTVEPGESGAVHPNQPSAERPIWKLIPSQTVSVSHQDVNAARPAIISGVEWSGSLPYW